jgi:hypothetical protein
MKTDFHIKLEARNPEKGHLRAYSIDAGQDLFGQWNIEVTYGRIGRRGRSVIYSASDAEEAQRIVRHLPSTARNGAAAARRALSGPRIE